MIKLAELPQTLDLREFSRFLHQQDIPHRISASGNGQILWLYHKHQQATVNQWLELWRTNQLSFHTPNKVYTIPHKKPQDYWQAARRTPVAISAIALCLWVAIVTHLGTKLSVVLDFTFLKPDLYGFASLSDTLASGQWWRLISPIVLHFGWTHLIFNMLWLYELGRRIESAKGSVFLLALILISGPISNMTQYALNSAHPLFGGFSGVVYALLGYIWFYHRQHSLTDFVLPSGFFWLLLIWLLMGYTGWLSAWVNMANDAHAAGLLTGALLGFIQGKCYHLRHNNP